MYNVRSTASVTNANIFTYLVYNIYKAYVRLKKII